MWVILNSVFFFNLISPARDLYIVCSINRFCRSKTFCFSLLSRLLTTKKTLPEGRVVKSSGYYLLSTYERRKRKISFFSSCLKFSHIAKMPAMMIFACNSSESVLNESRTRDFEPEKFLDAVVWDKEIAPFSFLCPRFARVGFYFYRDVW